MNSTAKQFLFILLLCHQVTAFSQNADINLLKKINNTETDFKTGYAELTTGSVITISIAAPAGIAIAGFIKKDKKLKQDALYMGISFLSSSLITQLTKHAVNRKRPFADYPFIYRRVDENVWLSFPSGHTSASFCTATTLVLRYRKWYVVVPSYLYAASIGWARMYQGVHYPSDVLAGAVIGAGSAWLGWKLQNRIQGKKEQKKKLTL